MKRKHKTTRIKVVRERELAKHRATDGMHEEQRRFLAGRAQGDQRRIDLRRAVAHAHEPRESLDRVVLKQRRDRELHAEARAYTHKQKHHKQQKTAEIEEALRHTDRVY